MLCNDCGVISPQTGSHEDPPVQYVAERSVSSHHWKRPKKAPRRWVPLCAECYRDADAKADSLQNSLPLLRNLALMSLLACIPGLPFLLGKRILHGTGLLSIAVGFALYIPEAFLACEVLSIASSVYWSIRLRRHTKNIEELHTYKRAWRQGHEMGSATQVMLPTRFRATVEQSEMTDLFAKVSQIKTRTKVLIVVPILFFMLMLSINKVPLHSPFAHFEIAFQELEV